MERKALACIWGLEHYKQFIWGTEITLRSDHKPLTKFLTTKGVYNATPRFARMPLRLFEYNYKVEYMPGIHNKVADYLSRFPLPITLNHQDAEELSVASIEGHFECISKEKWDT